MQRLQSGEVMMKYIPEILERNLWPMMVDAIAWSFIWFAGWMWHYLPWSQYLISLALVVGLVPVLDVVIRLFGPHNPEVKYAEV